MRRNSESSSNNAKALILDLDGVVIDSEPLWREAGVEVFRSVGVPMTVGRITETMGMRIDEDVAYWYERYPWSGASLEDVAKRWIAGVTALVSQRGEAKPGLLKLLDAASSLGWQIAVASASPLAYVRAVTDQLDVTHYMDAIISAEHEEYGKPHPGVFLTAAREIGVAPQDCVVIEDSPNGVIAAKAARMRCIAMPDSIMAGRREFCVADLQVGSLEEITLAVLEGL